MTPGAAYLGEVCDRLRVAENAADPAAAAERERLENVLLGALILETGLCDPAVPAARTREHGENR